MRRSKTNDLRVSDTLRRAQLAHQGGRSAEAERLYRDVLRIDPDAPGAVMGVASLAFQSGRPHLARDVLRRWVRRSPDDGGRIHALAIALAESGDPRAAMTCLRQAVALVPSQSTILNDLGVQQQDMGQPSVARRSYGCAVAVDPGSHRAKVNLANAWRRLGRPDRALQIYRAFDPSARADLAIVLAHAETAANVGAVEEAIALTLEAQRRDPRNADVWLASGTVASRLPDKEGAYRCFRRAAALAPQDAPAWRSMGILAHGGGLVAKACSWLSRAVQIAPEAASIRYDRATVLEGLGDPRALPEYERTVELRSDYAEAWTNLGNLLGATGRLTEARAAHRRAVAANPDFPLAHNNLGNALRDQGYVERACLCYRRGLTLDPAFVDCHRNLLAAVLYLPGLSNEAICAEAKTFARQHSPPHAAVPRFANAPDPDRRLRVAFLSSDFRAHPVGRNIRGLYAHLDRAAFELFSYSLVQRPDADTEWFRSKSDIWREVGHLTDAAIAEVVRRDVVDILIVLAGRFDRNRPLVAAYHGAPVQLSAHDGATTGLAAYDGWLTDGNLSPEGGEERFVEPLTSLDCFYNFVPLAPPPNGMTPTLGRKLRFVSCSNPAKIGPSVAEVWAEILRQVPDSVLRLKYKNWYADPATRGRITALFAATNIAESRLEFLAGLDDRPTHLASYFESDIALDPFPFGGTTTTFEALSAGVPVVTLLGQRFIGRVAASILYEVGLPRLVAHSVSEYRNIAVALALRPEELSSLRAVLPGSVRTSRLCDEPAYARDVAQTLCRLWRKWCRRQVLNS
jgi:predicted O-linked N-acetylglucosamine transferase (SPINDLY family)